MTLFTVLGSSGFIGSHLANKLLKDGFSCYCPGRRGNLLAKNLGHVIDCVGLTADFRTKPFETVEAHVCRLLGILQQCDFDSFLYLSSTRVYSLDCTSVAKEEDTIRVNPLKFDDIYNISKVMGESVCLASGRNNVRVVRLSNVYGYDSKSENFVFMLIRDALNTKSIILSTSLNSSKDHISVENVVGILPQIAIDGKREIYNIASGNNVTVGQIVDRLKEVTGCTVSMNSGSKQVCYPKISISRIRDEFAFTPASILDDIKALVDEYKKHGGAK